MDMEQLVGLVQQQGQQIAQLLQQQQQQQQQPQDQHQAARRVAGQKITQFGNEAGESWLGWRDSFENTVALNGYNDLEQRLALAGAMKGKAKLATMDIKVQEPINGQQPTIALALVAYQERFMPAAASHLARTKFEAAKQGPTEEILDYHSRLRALFAQAYPNAADDTMLIRNFVRGLRRRELRVQAMRVDPQTYPAALAAAQHEAAVQQQNRVQELGHAAGEEPMEIDALQEYNRNRGNGQFRRGRGGRTGQDSGNRGLCHFCQAPGHFKRECELWKRSQRGPPQGNRGGSGGRPRRAIMAAIEAALTNLEVGEESRGSAQNRGADGGSDF